MKTLTQTTRKKRAPAAPLPLKIFSLALTQTEADMLASLAQEQKDLIGRTISRSSIVRGLIRLAYANGEPVALRDAIENEIGQGRKWGHDSTKPAGAVIVSRRRPRPRAGKKRSSKGENGVSMS